MLSYGLMFPSRCFCDEMADERIRHIEATEIPLESGRNKMLPLNVSPLPFCSFPSSNKTLVISTTYLFIYLFR
jgi:hypothetical protein